MRGNLSNLVYILNFSLISTLVKEIQVRNSFKRIINYIGCSVCPIMSLVARKTLLKLVISS